VAGLRTVLNPVAHFLCRREAHPLRVPGQHRAQAPRRLPAAALPRVALPGLP
ncbi:unnamed protein product, partial [Heterosigma akashiwo]